MTVDEFERTYEGRLDGFWEELIGGDVYLTPFKRAYETRIQNNVYHALRPLGEQGFTVLMTVACRVTDDSLPNTDACAILSERWKATPRDEFFRGSPELVLLIKSPSNTGRKLRKKEILYLDHGAEQVWSIQPESRTVAVKTPEGDERVIREDGRLEFRSLILPVAGIFDV